MKSCHSSHFSSIPELLMKPLPEEIITEFCSRLNFTSLESCITINKEWHKASIQFFNKKKEMLSLAFSPRDWEIHFPNNEMTIAEKKEAYDCLPANIDEIPCPIYEGKKMIETHVFTYFPNNLTIISFGKLLKKKLGNSMGYTYIWEEIIEKLGDIPIKGGWKAMTKEALPNSNGEIISKQKALVNCLNQTSFKIFRVPLVLEAVVCISTEFFKSGNRMFFQSNTRCKENLLDCQLVVRQADGIPSNYNPKVYSETPIGLLVSYYSYYDIGVAAIRDF